MKMLGNSSRGLISNQKKCLYRCYTLLIVLYGFQLWYYNKTSLSCSLKELRKIQRRAALWISGAFHISPTLGIEAIASLIVKNERSGLNIFYFPFSFLFSF